MKIRLSAEDAARLGCPAEFEHDESKLMAREAIALKRITGWTPERFGAALEEGEPVLDGDGKQMFAMEGGQRVKDPAGNPIPLRTIDMEVMLVLVWLAVRRVTGTDVPWKDFDIDLLAMVTEGDDEGKGPTSTSKTSSNGTKSRSRTASASRRGTSGKS